MHLSQHYLDCVYCDILVTVISEENLTCIHLASWHRLNFLLFLWHFGHWGLSDCSWTHQLYMYPSRQHLNCFHVLDILVAEDSVIACEHTNLTCISHNVVSTVSMFCGILVTQLSEETLITSEYINLTCIHHDISTVFIFEAFWLLRTQWLLVNTST